MLAIIPSAHGPQQAPSSALRPQFLNVGLAMTRAPGWSEGSTVAPVVPPSQGSTVICPPGVGAPFPGERTPRSADFRINYFLADLHGCQGSGQGLRVVLALLRRVYSASAPNQGDVGSDGIPVVGGDGEHGNELAKQVVLESDALAAGYEQVPRSERISRFSLCSEACVAACRSAAAGSWDGGYSPPRKRAVKPACSKCRSKASASWIWRVSMTMKLAQSTMLQL